MDAKKRKKIPYFKEYKKSVMRLNEEKMKNISIAVTFWDEAIEKVSKEMLNVEIAGICPEWQKIVDYCKNKYIILGRELPKNDDDVVEGQIRDLLFQYYGGSFSDTNYYSNFSFNTSIVGSKTLVISELADAILYKIKVETGLIMDGQSAETVRHVSLCGIEDMIEDEGIEEVADVIENKKVIGFSEWSKKMNELFIRDDGEAPVKKRPDANQEQVESFAHNKSKRKELISALTGIEHPQAEDLKSDVGSAFQKSDIEDELGKDFYDAFEAVGDGGIIYAGFEKTFWIRKDDELIRII